MITVDKQYPEQLWSRVGRKASQALGVAEKDFFEGVGKSFVYFVKDYKFDQLMGSIGRQYREFVMNLDNVHHYLGEMFTQMKAPSYFVESETADGKLACPVCGLLHVIHDIVTGMILVYRSKRRGYAHYTIGQMKEISKVYFNLDIKMELLKQEIQFDTILVKYKLEFDNKCYLDHVKSIQQKMEQSLPFKAYALFDTFPFSILFDKALNIVLVGNALRKILPQCIGQPILEHFKLERPLVNFQWENLLTKTNNLFVFQVLGNPVKSGRLQSYKLMTDEADKQAGQASRDDLMIRGQMVYVEEWKKILFLGCPAIASLKVLIDSGLCISDLSTHDLSRDIMMAAIQRDSEKKMREQLAKQTYGKLQDITKNTVR